MGISDCVSPNKDEENDRNQLRTYNSCDYISCNFLEKEKIENF